MIRYFILSLVLLSTICSENVSDDVYQNGYIKDENLVEIEKTDQNNTCEGFRCNDNQCTSGNLTCNGIPDCLDHSDEDSCTNISSLSEKGLPCFGNDFRCLNGRCILASWKCDHRDDCGDNSDELDCPLPETCEKGQYSCGDGMCISVLWRCDGESDCADGSDEKNCSSTLCDPVKEMRCDNGQCLPIHWACDGTKDCFDGTDENMCDRKKTCDLSEFKCDDGLCINMTLVCNQKRDCADGSDEKNCSKTCKEYHYQCNDGATCIYEHEVCDQHKDCPDGDDEVNCDRKKTCELSEFKCDDGLCINMTLVCNQKRDCADGSDEKNCSKTCKEYHYQCNDGATCIYEHEVCDQHKDCPDGDDEINCNRKKTCDLSEFKCDDGLCINMTLVCNQKRDCADGSDEKNCSTIPLCSSEQYLCTNTSRCIAKRWVCDGDDDCGDASDEDPETCLRPVKNTAVSGIQCEEYYCNVSQECVSWTKVCDGQNDCKDSTDEGGMCGTACTDDHKVCSQVCQKTPQGPKCSCHDGYVLSPDNFTCEDVNECDILGSCSQICNNTDGGFTCSCAEGYVLNHQHKCKAVGPATLLYLLPDEIRGIDLSTHSMRIYVNESRGDLRDLDYDALQGVFFWIDWRKSTVNSYTISNNTRKVLFNIQRPVHLRWDWIHKNFYIISDTEATIMICNKIGEFCSTVVSYVAQHVSSFDISPSKGLMFWSVWGAHAKGIIERAEMDGSHRMVIVNEGLVWPAAVTVDHVMERIYWIDVKLNVMESTDYHGLRRRVVVSDDMYYGMSMALFEDFVFWSDWGTDKIIKCDKYSGQNCVFFHQGQVKSEAIMIVHDGYQPKGQNRCLNHDCPQLCIPNRTSFVCKCDDDYNLVNGTCVLKTDEITSFQLD